MIETKQLLECLKWIKKGVSKNESRRNLMNVEFRKTGDQLRIMSANAYIILTQTFKNQDDRDDYVFQAVGKSLDEIETVLKLNTGIKSDWHTRSSYITCNNESGALLKVDWLKTARTIETSEMEFPNLDNLINGVDSKGKSSTVELNNGKIKLNAERLKICLSGFENPIIEFTGRIGAVKIHEAELDDSQNWIREAIIMPINFKE